jgi:antibiotic biosynthesis monooxygenase (ABM) superfamily enzyme
MRERAVSLVTQVRVLPERDPEFERWQRRLNAVVAEVEGFLDSDLIQPRPPLQEDWVVVQRFSNTGAARAWLQSAPWQDLVCEVQPHLVGHADVHLFAGGDGRRPSAVSAIISTTVAPGQEHAFLDWHHRIMAAQARFPGYEGYRLERPIPGVQDDWVAILRFDSEEHLEAWLRSDERRSLLQEGGQFASGAHVRIVKSGFESWFPAATKGTAAAPPATWKQSMLVLLMLYPLVFLFGEWVHEPLLVDNGLSFWLALFIGNAVSVMLLGWVLIPWISRRFGWWLNASGAHRGRANWLGAMAVVALYALTLAALSQYP